jgi:hypothetical protein
MIRNQVAELCAGCSVEVLPGGGVVTAHRDCRRGREVFADILGAGPVATTAQKRRLLLRYASRAIVSQYLDFFACPGDARTTVRVSSVRFRLDHA